MTSSGARAHARPLPGLLAARVAALFPLAAAAAMLTLGILLIFGPDDSPRATAVLIGIALVVTGVLRLVRGVAAGGDAGTHRGTHVLIGLLAALAGIFCLGQTEPTAVLLSLVAGLFWAMHGLVDLVASGTPGPGRVLAGITGGLSLLAGVTVILWPAITVPVLAVAMAIWFGCDGALIAVTALYLRHIATRPRPGSAAPAGQPTSPGLGGGLVPERGSRDHAGPDHRSPDHGSPDHRMDHRRPDHRPDHSRPRRRPRAIASRRDRTPSFR